MPEATVRSINQNPFRRNQGDSPRWRDELLVQCRQILLHSMTRPEQRHLCRPQYSHLFGSEQNWPLQQLPLLPSGMQPHSTVHVPLHGTPSGSRRLWQQVSSSCSWRPPQSLHAIGSTQRTIPSLSQHTSVARGQPAPVEGSSRRRNPVKRNPATGDALIASSVRASITGDTPRSKQGLLRFHNRLNAMIPAALRSEPAKLKWGRSSQASSSFFSWPHHVKPALLRVSIHHA